MKRPFADESWKAAVKEIETLEKMGVWDVVDHPEGANVVYSTWAFKLKCYPDGLIKKFKACFVFVVTSTSMVLISLRPCSVLQWTTIWLMLILEVILGLKSKQGDITTAFVLLM
jgi:hypothetical protein